MLHKARSHLLAATLLFAASLALFWPGYAEYDTLRQYEQVVSNQLDDWHPPIMARRRAGSWLGLALIADALTAIEDGTMTATVSSDGPWQGGIGLAIGYCVATGEMSVDDIADEDRAWFAEQFLITGDNVGD
mgnify:CR=1 FL=1